VLVCGVFGNTTDDDVRRTIGYYAQLCAHGGTVVWTRNRRDPVPLARGARMFTFTDPPEYRSGPPPVLERP